MGKFLEDLGRRYLALSNEAARNEICQDEFSVLGTLLVTGRPSIYQAHLCLDSVSIIVENWNFVDNRTLV
jgi:hypothetical protein